MINTRDQAISIQVSQLPPLEENIGFVKEHDGTPYFCQPEPLRKFILDDSCIRAKIAAGQ